MALPRMVEAASHDMPVTHHAAVRLVLAGLHPAPSASGTVEPVYITVENHHGKMKLIRR
jgi:hypothetical protein